MVEYAKSQGILIEYEIHAVSYLLPRELFGSHPEYFRADESGIRHQQSNFCVSNDEAMEIVVNNAEKL